MKILDGKKLAERILHNIKRKIARKHLKLTLAIIIVGENRISQIFIRQKEKACNLVGIRFQLFSLSSKMSIKLVVKEIAKITHNPNYSGIIVQLPLPKKFPQQEILNLIPPEKDIDVLSEVSLGKFYAKTLLISPPTVEGISRLLATYKIPIKGKNIVLIGAGDLVGLPLALWFLGGKATVSVAHKFTKDIASLTKKADVVVSGVGKPNLVKGTMVKKGVVVIDAGTSQVKGKVTGDIDFETVAKKASFITPVPGGVGPMTVACLLENLVKLNSK